MSVSFKAPMALGFLLAIPLFALPAQGAPVHGAAQEPARHQAHQSQDFAIARAFVSPAPAVFPAHETDGLSRNAEECSRGGCIDN
jgi:hypothetical protein